MADKPAVATGCWQDRKTTSGKRSDTGQQGVRAGQSTTVRENISRLGRRSGVCVDGYQKRCLWACTTMDSCVCELCRGENRTAPAGSAWYSIDKTLRLMISEALFHFLFPRQGGGDSLRAFRLLCFTHSKHTTPLFESECIHNVQSFTHFWGLF